MASLSFMRLTVLGVGSGSSSSSSVSSAPWLFWYGVVSTSDSSVNIALPLPLQILAARVCGLREWEVEATEEARTGWRLEGDP